MSPSDLGQLIKPFVFLDLFDFEGARAPALELGWHPHSGIATVTVVLDGSVRYAETTGSTGVLPAGGVEWMQAGGGVWHTGSFNPERVRGFQLWVALPPELENAPSRSHYLLPERVPETGPVRVLLGSYQGLSSPIAAPPMTYLLVTLKGGARWTYQPPAGHEIAWAAVMDGALGSSARIAQGEIAIFERSEAAIEVVADGDTRFVLGSAAPHPHDLVLGNYSVHTSAVLRFGCSNDPFERARGHARRAAHALGAALHRAGRTSVVVPLALAAASGPRRRGIRNAGFVRRCPRSRHPRQARLKASSDDCLVRRPRGSVPGESCWWRRACCN